MLGGRHPDPARGRAAHPRPGPAGLLAPRPARPTSRRTGSARSRRTSSPSWTPPAWTARTSSDTTEAVPWLVPQDAPRRAGRLPHRALDAAPERTGPLDDPLAATPAQLVHVRRAGAGAPELVMARTLGPALRLSGLPADLAEVRPAHGQPRRRCAAHSRGTRRLRAGHRGTSPGAAARGGVDLVWPPTTYVWGWHDPSLGRARPRRPATTSPGTTSSSSWTPVTGCPSCIPTRWPVPSSTASSTRADRARDGRRETPAQSSEMDSTS